MFNKIIILYLLLFITVISIPISCASNNFFGPDYFPDSGKEMSPEQYKQYYWGRVHKEFGIAEGFQIIGHLDSETLWLTNEGILSLNGKFSQYYYGNLLERLKHIGLGTGEDYVLSPDEKYLIYRWYDITTDKNYNKESQHQLCIYDFILDEHRVITSQSAALISGTACTGFYNFRWSPDSKYVYYTSSIYYRDKERGLDLPSQPFIARYSIETNRHEIICYPPLGNGIFAFEVSPDGEKIMTREGIGKKEQLESNIKNDRGEDINYAIFIYHLKTGERKRVYSPAEFVGSFTWCLDSWYFAFGDSGPGKDGYTGHLVYSSIDDPSENNRKILLKGRQAVSNDFGDYNICNITTRPLSNEGAFWHHILGENEDGISLINYETGVVTKGILYAKVNPPNGGGGGIAKRLFWSKDGRFLIGYLNYASRRPGGGGLLAWNGFVIDFQEKKVMIIVRDKEHYEPVYLITNPEIIKLIKERGFKSHDKIVKEKIERIKAEWPTKNSISKKSSINWLRSQMGMNTPSPEVREEVERQLKQWETELAGQSEPPKPK